MVSVRINGEDAPIKTASVTKVAELIELIKSMIDPDHMITGILLNGRDLEEHEWQASLSQFGTAIFEIQTGTMEGYVHERLDRSGSIIANCYMQFRSARKSFQAGDMVGGNKKLIEAVNALRAFFEWWGTLVQLMDESRREQFNINPQVEKLTETCKKICQQQLYQSWWALGETLEKDLEPKLDKLEDFLRTAVKPH